MSQAIRPLIDTAAMATRVRDYGPATTNQVVTMMMSGVFATSALAIADILRTPDEFWVRLTLWLWASVSAVMTMTRQLHRNSLIVHPSPAHVPAQLAVGFVVAATFALIPLSTGGAEGWRYAYAAQVLTVVIGYLSHSLLRASALLEYYSPELRAAVKKRGDFLEVSFRVALPFALAFMAGAVFIAWLSKFDPDPWTQILVGVNILFALLSLYVLAAELRSFKDLLSDIEAAHVATLPKERATAQTEEAAS